MGRKGTNGQKLSSAEIRKLTVMLIAKRNEILGNVNEMESESPRRVRTDLSNTPLHMADAGSDNYEIENTLGLMDSGAADKAAIRRVRVPPCQLPDSGT